MFEHEIKYRWTSDDVHRIRYCTIEEHYGVMITLGITKYFRFWGSSWSVILQVRLNSIPPKWAKALSPERCPFNFCAALMLAAMLTRLIKSRILCDGLLLPTRPRGRRASARSENRCSNTMRSPATNAWGPLPNTGLQKRWRRRTVSHTTCASVLATLTRAHLHR